MNLPLHSVTRKYFLVAFPPNNPVTKNSILRPGSVGVKLRGGGPKVNGKWQRHSCGNLRGVTML